MPGSMVMTMPGWKGVQWSGVVDVQADMMAKTVNGIDAKRLAVKILSMRVDVVVSNLVDVLVTFATEVHPGLERGKRGVLRAKDDVVDFALARRVFAVGRNRARDICRVARVLRGHVQHDDVAVFDFA